MDVLTKLNWDSYFSLLYTLFFTVLYANYISIKLEKSLGWERKAQISLISTIWAGSLFTGTFSEVDLGTHNVGQRAKKVPGPSYCLHPVGRADLLLDSLCSANRISPFLWGMERQFSQYFFSHLSFPTSFLQPREQQPTRKTTPLRLTGLPVLFLSWILLWLFIFPNFENMHFCL